MHDIDSRRRALLLAPLVAPLLAPLVAGLASAADASPLDPAQTAIRLPDALRWTPMPGYPERSVDMCPLFGATSEPGLYYTLVRWWPGYMSAPHSYVTDRLCVVVSGVWHCNSGADFDPASCAPVPAGGFVRRVARTPHYDGVIRAHDEPAVIAICGIGPVGYALADPSQPGWRRV